MTEPADQQQQLIEKIPLAKFFSTLLWNQPRKFAQLIYAGSQGAEKLGLFLGEETTQVLKYLRPNIHAIIQTLLSSPQNMNIDELYEQVQPHYQALLEQPIGPYGVSLKGLNIIEKVLTESYIKQDLLPLFVIVRDIPKFCQSIKEKNLLKVITESRALLMTHMETDINAEIRKDLIIGPGDLYELLPSDPALVSQIKKILNALTYAEKIVTFINSLDLGPSKSSPSGFRVEEILQAKGEKEIDFIAQVVWDLAMTSSDQNSYIGDKIRFKLDFNKGEEQFIEEVKRTLDYARKAQTSLLEIDLPIFQLFSKELGMINGIIKSFDVLTTSGTTTLLKEKFGDTKKVAQTTGDYIGKPIGLFIDHLTPHLGKTDYSILTQHLGLLPGYLDRISQLINIYGAGKPHAVQELNEAQREIFKDSAIKLFFEISHYEQHFFLQKTHALLFPIRKEAVTLGQGVYEQVLRTTKVTGEAVAYLLSRLKTRWFAELICESDKLELDFGLEPGVLTNPLMLQINSVYQVLVDYAKYLVDIEKEYPDLLQFDNTSLLSQRLQHTLYQQNNCQAIVIKAKKARTDLAPLIEHLINSSKMDPLTPELWTTLWEQYQSIKPYVIEYNPRLSVFIDDYFTKRKQGDMQDSAFTEEDLKNMQKAVEQLCHKQVKTYECYVNIASSRLSAIPKQIKGKLFELDPERTYSFLLLSETQWLKDNGANTDALPDQGEFIADLGQLTSANRACLHQYHAIRRITLEFINKEVDLFLKQLREADCFTNQKKINAIIERYRILQPYVVNSLQPVLHDAETDFVIVTPHNETDSEFVTLLNQLANQKEKPVQESATLRAIKSAMEPLKRQLEAEKKRSEKRQLVFEFAHQEESNALVQQEILTLDSELVQRQTKWIRHQKLSKASEEMKKQLAKLMEQLDPSLKLVVLDTPESDIPFPEMNDPLESLKVPTQVSWAKRMLNIVHYIHVNFKYLESLEKEHKQDVLSYFLGAPIVEGIYQLNPFITMINAYQSFVSLLEEPAGQVFYDTLHNGYSGIMEAWSTLKPLYAVDPKEVTTEEEKIKAKKGKNSPEVENKALWYPLVSLMVIPEHLTALAEGTTYTSSEAAKAQQTAKKITLFTEKVTQQFQAGKYIRLFLQSPYIGFVLWPELKGKIAKFRTDTHGITINHLSDIQATLQKILLETDAFELKFGLKTGLISKPVKLIVDQLFYSFMEPLRIDLDKSTPLILDTSSFKQRRAINQQQQAQTATMLQSEHDLYTALDQFLIILGRIHTKITTNQDISLAERNEFKMLYWKMYPQLQAQHSNYSLSMDQRDKSAELDEFCNACLQEQLEEVKQEGHSYHYPSLTDVLHLTKHVHAAKKGNVNSLEMKRDYLKAQEKSIVHAEHQFTKEEAKETLKVSVQNAIDLKIDLLCRKAGQSVYLAEELNSKLKDMLLARKETILKKLSTIPVKKLEQTITEELEQQFELFTKTEYQHLSHLDAILTEIERFQTYCQKEKLNPIYEDVDPISGTLLPKIKVLNHLKTIIFNTKEPLEKRIAMIQQEAKKDSFYTILMNHDNHIRFNLKTLKRIFLNLFHSIFNFFGASYRPADFYSPLDKVIKNEVDKPNKFSLKKIGFFEDKTKESGNTNSSSDTQDLMNKPLVPKGG